MEKDREKFIQEEILKTGKNHEQTSGVSMDDDQAAYRLVFEALAEKDELNIPRNFAEVVTKKAVRKKKISFVIHSALMYMIPIAFLLIASFSSLYFLSKETFDQMLRFARSYGNYLAFAFVIILMIQLADRWLLSNRPRYFIN